MADLQIQNFRGIRKVNPVADLFSSRTISAQICTNVELKNTAHADNVAIYSAKGNAAVKNIKQNVVGQFYAIQNGIPYWYIYATDAEKGYLYTFDINRDQLEELQVELSATKTCNGITIAQGYDDWFVFTNGKDDFVAINLAQELEENRIKFLNATDAEGRDIRGLGLEVQEGRLVTFCENRVHWSAQGNIFDWLSSDPDLITSPAYQEFDRPVTAIVYYNNMLVAFTNETSVCFHSNPANPLTFSRSGASGGGCPSFRSVIKFDNKLFYYDDVAKNVFAYYLLDSGQTRPSQGLADNIVSYFEQIDHTRINEIELVALVQGERNEIWFKMPTLNRNMILIYDYMHQEWIERYAQNDIKALLNVNGALYSASQTNILKEYVGNTFNGTYIPSQYKMNVINLSSDSNVKIPKMPLILTLDFAYENDFFIEFIYDDNPDKKRVKHIIKLLNGYLIWSYDQNDQSGGKWAFDENDDQGGAWVSLDKNTVMFNLDGIMAFKQLQIRIYTKSISQEFGIKRLEIKRVRQKDKSLG